MQKQYLYVETYGCQMNEYDSDRIRNSLNYETTQDPEKADVVIINTCAIRQKADQKALSSVGKFKHIKAKNPNLIVGIAGCVAQLYGEKLLHKIPHLDLVLGPRAIPKLPKLISQIKQDKRKSVETSLDIEEVFEVEAYHEEGKVTAFVSVQQGCNKKCSYCIVPYVRGKEINRQLNEIIKETTNLVNKGVKEITLIGQTVNSWKENGYKFSDLLKLVADIEGLERIRYTTSYPRDVTRKMIDAMREISKVCNHIHLPVQSGSNSILASMKRTYTREWYLDIVKRLRDSIPDISITTDIIVGFPGESEKDFNDTLELLEEVEFDTNFSFKFSPRPGTPAAELKDVVPETIANKRLARLQKLQRDITLRKNLNKIG
ncbi:tRNA (N6-isopentenyl adenosine(37)-C2)-methylthiotransferase MiaB, partial [Desulfobacterota bacterium AH_259_B03_O07]|nr:tRNA (N6-isopentenyl adenosine(37)-C2)-methylthiotransferase MiaB [Desulfobacterota bacterium AH_259_B03_O07]